jgi:hypothetical protein
LGLARALLGERPLWLLDEPDNCLDVQGEQYLGEALEQHLPPEEWRGGLHRNLVLPTPRVSVLDLSRSVIRTAMNEQVAACDSCARERSWPLEGLPMPGRAVLLRAGRQSFPLGFGA